VAVKFFAVTHPNLSNRNLFPVCYSWKWIVAETEGESMADDATRVRELLHEAGETHHQVYRISEGDDPDWASWYADWLIHLSELPQILGGTPVPSELVYMLVRLDKEYTEKQPTEEWPDYYAAELLKHFSK
jgi:hypothetical protein